MTTYGLYCYCTGTRLRDASNDEIERSRAECRNGYSDGVIMVDRRLCLTDEHQVQRSRIASLGASHA